MQQIFARFVPWFLTDEQNQQKHLVTANMAVVSKPHYLPDLAPCAFFLFPRIKSQL
jgi:hypothetical protein